MKKIQWLVCVFALMSLGGCKSEPAAPAVPETCATSEGCKQEGKCTDENGKCVVGSATDCAQSKICKLEGRCAVTTVGGTRVCQP